MQLAEDAGSLQPAQVPLVFWGFARLGYRPDGAALSLLEVQVRRTATQLSAQVPNHRLTATTAMPAKCQHLQSLQPGWHACCS